MVSVSLPHPYAAHRFHVDFGPARERDAIFRLGGVAGGRVGAIPAFSNPFEPDELWLAAAHREGMPTMFERATEECDRAKAEMRARCVSVWLHGGRGADAPPRTRLISATFTHTRWLPLQLDAAKSDAAVEWLVLCGVVYRGVEE